jgi:hypothetical protein
MRGRQYRAMRPRVAVRRVELRRLLGTAPSNTAMSLLLTYRHRLNPTRRQHAILGAILEQQRQLYNAALAERIDCYEKTGRSISNAEQARSLTQIRADDPAFAAVPRRIQRWTINLVDHAFKGMFQRAQEEREVGTSALSGSGSLADLWHR